MSRNQPGPREAQLRQMREQQLSDEAKSTLKRIAKSNPTGVAKPPQKAQTVPRKESEDVTMAKKTKTAKAVALLTRSSGTTGREILDATGWPSISVPAFAKAQGLKLKKKKVEGRMHYFAKPSAAGASASA